MGYTMLERIGGEVGKNPSNIRDSALTFIRERCQDLRFSEEKKQAEAKGPFLGAGLHPHELPYNMQMDVERLCLERALDRFLSSGTREDAFDVYFCYLEMFVGDYEKTSRMIELLSEFESNGSRLLMKHRDHYSHAVYVFALGLAFFQNTPLYREEYCHFYGLTDEGQAACHYLQYWGLAALFHDIGYPFELPFEEVASYFEVSGDRRKDRPFVAYQALQSLVDLSAPVQGRLATLFPGQNFSTSNELFAWALAQKLSEVYPVSQQSLLTALEEIPLHPDKFNHFMDHAYFSATVLLNKLFCEMGLVLEEAHVDALTAILLHNSLYKFTIAHYKEEGNRPFSMELHPLAYMLMLCDELQCWDRMAYGRNSKLELHPMDCRFQWRETGVDAIYLFDNHAQARIHAYQEAYGRWQAGDLEERPKLKAYSDLYEKNAQGVSEFLSNIARIVNLDPIGLQVGAELCPPTHGNRAGYLSRCNFLSLYRFALVLNGRWNSAGWQKAKAAGMEEAFLADPDNLNQFSQSFKSLSLEYKLSNINQAKAFARYLDAVDCFYTDQETDLEMVDHFSPEELAVIGPLEHQRWLQEHYDMGWAYGTPDRAQRELVRLHPDMIPGFDLSYPTVTREQAEANYLRLDQGEQDKDTAPMECMLAMLRMFDGLRIYRLKS